MKKAHIAFGIDDDPGYPFARRLFFQWTDDDGNVHRVESAILLEWSPLAMSRWLEQFAHAIREKHHEAEDALRAKKQSQKRK